LGRDHGRGGSVGSSKTLRLNLKVSRSRKRSHSKTSGAVGGREEVRRRDSLNLRDSSNRKFDVGPRVHA